MSITLFCRYLHGDLTVTSIENYGTDAHVFIKAISHESHEKLPIFNKTSSKHYNMVIGSNDWSSPVTGKYAMASNIVHEPLSNGI